MPKKKSFIDDLNPTMQFISSTNQVEQQATQKEIIDQPKQGYKLNPIRKETRNKRFNLLVQPNVYNSIKSISEKYGISMNSYIHKLLENTIKEEEQNL